MRRGGEGGIHQLFAPRRGTGTSVLCLAACPAWLSVLWDDRHGCPCPADWSRSRPGPASGAAVIMMMISESVLVVTA